ncbi:MAG: outer membrane protein transport protein [candidate division Zixibacteria bacterium]|nr:outer membrane protein transport protein [candidate division Zixibacteria bacterium]
MQLTRASIGLILLFAWAFSPVQADYIESVEEISAGNVFGIGARQMAMGGAGMMSIDGGALYYNPANLARIPRIEFLGGLSNQKYQDESSVRPLRKIIDAAQIIPEENLYSNRFAGYTSLPNHTDENRTNTRLSTAIISVPYPTYRGSLVIGFGVARTVDFDRVFSFAHRDTSAEGSIVAVGNEFQSGGLYQWSFGMGIDLSPRLSFGGSISLYTGKHKYNFDYSLDSLNEFTYYSEQYIEDSYLGYGAKIGMAMQVNRHLGFGITLQSPVYFNVDEDVYDYSTETYTDSSFLYEDAYTVEYDVKHPFVFSAGVEVSRIGNASFALDLDYTDWSQLSYGDNKAMEAENNNIKDYYRDVLRYRIGAEYTFPVWGLSLRAGLFTDPLPIVKQFENDSRTGYTFGFGLLVDQVMTVDFAYVHGSYGRNSDFFYGVDTMAGTDHYLVIDEDISYDRLFLTVAYRF